MSSREGPFIEEKRQNVLSEFGGHRGSCAPHDERKIPCIDRPSDQAACDHDAQGCDPWPIWL